MRRVVRMIACGAALAGACGPAGSQEPAPAPRAVAAAAEPAAPGLGARACPLLREAPAPVAAAEGGATCPVVQVAKEALARPELSEDALEALRRDIAGAVAAQPEACVAALGRELAATRECGIVYDAVAVRILTAAAVDPRHAAAELLRPSACQWKALAALREAKAVSPTIAATVSRLTGSADVDVASAAWMTLGTLARIAREGGDGGLAECIEGQLADELEARDDASRGVLVAAAGNAGCRRCGDALHAEARSADPSRRRTGVVALRFLADEEDVEALCRVLGAEPDAPIRGAAAFALRHGASHVERRLQCLFETATQDTAESVVHDAIASIAELAAGTELGVGMLVHVGRSAALASARAHAADALRAFASDDAIAALLNAP